MWIIILFIIAIIIFAIYHYSPVSSDKEEIIDNIEVENEIMGEGEEKIGSYEFSENKIQLKGIRENMAAANFASFIEMANLKDHRLVCIAGMPYSGVGHLAKMVNKKFGHKIIPRGPVEEQRKHFEGQTGNFVIEHCAPEDLAKLDS